MGEILTIDEACALVGCKPCTLISRLRAGDLPGTKIGRGWIIPRDAFVAGLNQLALEKKTRKPTPVPRVGRRRPLLAV